MGIKVRANPRWTVPGNSGSIATGWKVNTYEPGTSTPKDTYTDYLGGSANTNPVILDARGEAVIQWSGIYKVVVTDEDDVEVWSADNYGEGEDFVLTGNYNKVKNGSFETLTSGEPDNWTIVDYTNGSHEIDATDQYHGLNSLKFTSTGSGGGYATSDFFEVLGARVNTLIWSLKSSVADVRNVVDVLWYTSAKTLISTSNLYDDSATNPTSWATKTGEGTAPSTARYSKVRIYGCHSSDATSGSTWYDNVQFLDITIASTTIPGISERATQAEVDAGTDASRHITPETLASYIPVSPANYAGGIETHFHSNLANSTVLNLSSILSNGIYENVGPTGDPDNVWTALDDVPSTAKFIKVKIIVGVSGTTAETYSTKIYAAAYSESSPSTDNQHLQATALAENISGSSESTENMTHTVIPVDSSGRLQLAYVVTGTNNAGARNLYLEGWIE